MKVEGESRQVNRLVGWKAGPAICECKHCLLLWCWAEVATRCCRSAAGTDVSEKEAKDVSKVPNRRAFSRRCATLGALAESRGKFFSYGSWNPHLRASSDRSLRHWPNKRTLTVGYISFSSPLLYRSLPYYACVCAPSVPQEMHQPFLKSISQPKSAQSSQNNTIACALFGHRKLPAVGRLRSVLQPACPVLCGSPSREGHCSPTLPAWSTATRALWYVSGEYGHAEAVFDTYMGLRR